MPGVVDAQTLIDKAGRVVELAASGQLSPDVANSMLSALGALSKAMEIDELTRRIAVLEARNALAKD